MGAEIRKTDMGAKGSQSDASRRSGSGCVSLRDEVRIRVRFSEVDSLGMVWHGNYVKYIEDGREAFGRRYGLGYMFIYENGFIAPVVELNAQYRRPARVDDVLLVSTEYIHDRGAKIIYEFEIRDCASGELILTARSVQLFQSLDGELIVSKPDFIREWELKHGM